MPKRRLDVVNESPHPAYVVWELTLACDQPCTHCGSRAGRARQGELSTPQALDVVAQLAGMGAREVTMIGGEAYLHPGFLDVARSLVAAGIRASMTTGGRSFDQSLAQRIAETGIETVSVSIDGLERTHDLMRASVGSFAAASAALDHIRAAGMTAASNINLNRWNTGEGELEAVYDHLLAHGVRAWQVQLTAPLGRAADRPDLILQPFDLLDLMPRIANLKRRAISDGITLMLGNNVGYFGPDEALLRSLTATGADHWQGCQAGRFVMGIESDGAVKGCPSLQTAHYVGGNLKAGPLREIWNESPQLAFARHRTRDGLWGFCRTCEFAEPCLGGCSFTAHALLGRPGNNPYCHYRARTLARRGLRERIVQVGAPTGMPFDCGRFELIEEPLTTEAPQRPRSPLLLRPSTPRRLP